MSGVTLPRFTSWLCCMTLGKLSRSWKIPGLAEEERISQRGVCQMTGVPPGLENLKDAKMSWRQTGQLLYCLSERKETPEGIGHVLSSPSPHPVISLEGIKNNGSEDTVDQRMQLQTFVSFATSRLFFLLSPVLSIMFSFHEMRRVYLWG